MRARARRGCRQPTGLVFGVVSLRQARVRRWRDNRPLEQHGSDGRLTDTIISIDVIDSSRRCRLALASADLLVRRGCCRRRRRLDGWPDLAVARQPGQEASPQRSGRMADKWDRGGSEQSNTGEVPHQEAPLDEDLGGERTRQIARHERLVWGLRTEARQVTAAGTLYPYSCPGQ